MTARRVALPFTSAEDWHWRWVQPPSVRAIRLHRVLRCSDLDREWVQIHDVETVCGMTWKRGGMPGVLSRIGAPRCKACCKRLGIEQGNGAPYNSGMDEPGEVAL